MGETKQTFSLVGRSDKGSPHEEPLTLDGPVQDGRNFSVKVWRDYTGEEEG